MSENTLPPFRADHVGSLLRPAALTQARADFKAGTIDADALRAAEDEAIRGAIALQHDVGLKDATDGEFRRHSWHMDFILQLGGISEGGGEAPARAVQERGGRLRVRAAGHGDRRQDHPARHDLHGRLRLPARQRRRPGPEDHDPVAEHGPLPRRQLLDRQLGLPRPRPVLDRPQRRVRAESSRPLRPRRALHPARRHEPRVRQRPRAAQAHRRHRRRPRAPARAVHREHEPLARRQARRPADHHPPLPRQQPVDVGGRGRLRLRGRGALRRPGRRRLLPRVRRRALGRLRAAALRARGQVRRARPRHDEEARARGKDELKRRIEEASKHVPLDQLCLSPQCGFSSTEEGNKLTEDDQKAKLALVVETAAEVWG